MTQSTVVSDSGLAHLPPRPSLVRNLTTEQTQELRRRFPHLPTDLKRCITCRGQQRFRWYAPLDARQDVAEYVCSCVDQFISHRVMLYAGIGVNYQRLGWADFENIPTRAFEVVEQYLTNSDAFIAQGFGLVLSGPRGTGKSLMANLLLKDLVVRGYDCYLTTFAAMIDHFAEGWRSKEDRLWFDTRIRNARVLLIDDLGRERNKGAGSVGENMLEEVVRHRVAHAMPTLITTNADIDNLGRGYGGHTLSLLTERYLPCPFDGSDYRERLRERLRQEILAGLTRPIVWA